MEILKSGLFKMAVGVLIAIAVRLYMRNNGKPTHDDMIDEFRTLLPPALIVFVGFLAAGDGWMDAVEALLMSLAVPLGINSGKNVKEK